MPKKKKISKKDKAYLMMELGSLFAKIGFPISLAETIIFMRIPFVGIGMIWLGFGIFMIGKKKLKK